MLDRKTKCYEDKGKRKMAMTGHDQRDDSQPRNW